MSQNFYAPPANIGQQRQHDEVRSLKLIVERLSTKLREYQLRCGDEAEISFDDHDQAP